MARSSDACPANPTVRRLLTRFVASGSKSSSSAATLQSLEDAMNTTANHFASQPLISAGARFAIAAAIAAALAVAWVGAEHESHGAVIVAGTAMKAQALRVTLPA